MEKYEEDFRRNHERNQSYNRRDNDNWQDRNRDSGDSHKLQNYQSRYQERGNYFGMPDSNYEYRNVRSSEGSNFGHNSSGPVASYGANSYPQNRDSRQHNEQRNNQDRSGSGSRQNDSSDHYRYGDPNPYMNNDRNGGYERTRGTGWRSESDTYEGTSYGHNRYGRQDNSYTTGGEGRRYSSFGRDEEDNYGHNMRDRLDHGRTDRNEHERRRSDNDYTPERQYGSSGSDRNSNRSEWRNVSDKYSQHRGNKTFDHTDDDYPRSSRYDGHRSGPDWSADSAASDYSQSDLRG